MAEKKRILLFTDWYTPGYKAGGPIQSCKNLIAHLGNEFEFFILTSDRDISDNKPYAGIYVNKWVELNSGIHIRYSSPGNLNQKMLQHLIREVKPDIIYFNSMFSKNYTLLPLVALKRIRFRGRIILAPRGMLHSGAIQQKGLKKKLFLQFFRFTGWPRKIQFHATDEQELKDISSFFPRAGVKVASNIPNVDDSKLSFPVKRKDELNAIFISRIHPKKNLHFLLQLFRDLKPEQKLTFDIYGVADDEAYTLQCKKLATSLQDNVVVKFHGPLPSKDVLTTLKKSHVLMLPTLGENFGHAIFESLTVGRPVLISDQTPWRNLAAAKAGWDLPIANKLAFSDVIEQLLSMEQEEFNVWANGAKKHAVEYLARQDYFSTYSKLFNE